MKKIKLFITAFITFLSVGVINVNAEEFGEVYQKLTTDGTLTVTDTSLGTKRDLIYSTLSKVKVEDNSWFGISSCNDDYTSCEIYYNNNNDTSKNESHTLTIKYEEKYSDFFKTITTDGNIVVPFTSTELDDIALASEYVYSLSTKEYSASLQCENDDINTCAINVSKITIKNENEYHHTFFENHVVKISFKESYSDEFKKITTDGNLTINSIKPTTKEDAEALLTVALDKYATDSHSYYVSGCNETFTVCNVARYANYAGGSEHHKVNMKYITLDKNVQAKVNNVISLIKSGEKFIADDLELVNYIVNESKGENEDEFIYGIYPSLINYSKNLKDVIGNTNLRTKLDARLGWGDGEFVAGLGGNLVTTYNDISYGLVEEIYIGRNNVIYIPDNTKNTTEAFVAAAQKRINDYLENDKVKIKYAGKLADLDEEIYKDVIDVSKTNGEYYTLTYGKLEMKFFIQKDSTKIKEVKEEHKTSDIATNITISTESKDVPLDTAIKVEEIKKEDKKFTEITKKLEVKEAIVYDLKLYSSSKKNYVSKLDNGSFKVTIPVPEALKNIKKLSAYYIQDDGTIEEYPADPDEIKKGNIVFNTKHFSIYTIAESGKGTTKVTEKNPDTFDGITNSFILGLISLIGLCSALVISRKKQIDQ